MEIIVSLFRHNNSNCIINSLQKQAQKKSFRDLLQMDHNNSSSHNSNRVKNYKIMLDYLNNNQ